MNPPTWQGILTLSKFGGGGALIALPFITAGIWVLLHFHWVTVSNSGPINGTYRSQQKVETQ